MGGRRWWRIVWGNRRLLVWIWLSWLVLLIWPLLVILLCRVHHFIDNLAFQLVDDNIFDFSGWCSARDRVLNRLYGPFTVSV